ncbi:MAG: hypothetical protein PQJ59_16450 [Spirochaetales bacterium]|nr:hypothetical protein [Spirochaetales bacterium]
MKIIKYRIEPLIESVYLEASGKRNIPLKDYLRLKKSIKGVDSTRWAFVEYNDTERLCAIQGDIFLTGPLSMRKAKTEKDLEYWKKKLIDVLKMEKSLGDILFPGGVPEKAEGLLQKAKNFPIGTKRTWSGKEYKKVAGGPKGKGKWVRTYSETESRGAKQAIRNVQKKILAAESMEELVEIVQQNSSRFQDDKGNMLPIVKEFLSVARGTMAGKKEAKDEKSKYLKNSISEVAKNMNMSYEEVEKIYDNFKKENPKKKINFDTLYNEIARVKKEEGDKIKGELDEKKTRGKDKKKRKQRASDGSFDMSEEEAEELVSDLENKHSGIEFNFSGEDSDITFYAQVEKEDITENIMIDPYDTLEKDAKELKEEYQEGPKISDEKPEPVDTDYEKQEEKIEKKNDVPDNKPPAVEEEAQEIIESVTPENRQKKTLELGGTKEEQITVEELLGIEKVDKTKPYPFVGNREIHVGGETYRDKLNAMDYTGMDHREVLLMKYKDISAAGEDWKSIKPDYIPEIDMKMFSYQKNTLIFEKLDDGRYIVPLDQRYLPHGTTRRLRQNGEVVDYTADNIKKEYAVLTMDQVAATQDFYRKVAKAELDREHEERVRNAKERGYTGRVKKERLKVMSTNRMAYDQVYMIRESRNIKTGYVSESKVWEAYGELQAELKQKTIDMDLMREEVDNSFSKGRETSYGDSNTSDAMKDEYGVKIKRQNGSDVQKEDEEYLRKAMDNIQKTFGDRKSMNDAFGLKLSFAKGTAMHASKAVGIFIPMQNAIGISDGKGLKQKHPITGDMETVNYGDENFGGFVLSHEYAHMMDHYLGKKTGKWFASDDYNSTAGKIAATFRSNMNKESKSNYTNRTCECFARALEQYHAMEIDGPQAQSFFSPYVESSTYVNQEKFESEIKPLIEQFFKENDALLKSIKISF